MRVHSCVCFRVWLCKQGLKDSTFFFLFQVKIVLMSFSFVVNDLTSGTRIAHKIAKAAIDELITEGDSFGHNKENIGGRIFHPSREDLLLNLDDPHEQRSDDEDEDASVVSALSVFSAMTTATSLPAFSPALLPREGDCYSDIELRLPPNSNWVVPHALRYFFMKLRTNMENGRLIKVILTAWGDEARLMRKMKTVALHLHLKFRTFWVDACFQAFKSQLDGMHRLKDFEKHVSHVRELKMKARTLLIWRVALAALSDRATRSRQASTLLRVLDIKRRNHLLRSMKRLRSFAIVKTAWLLMLAFHHLRHHTKDFLAVRGKLRGRRSCRIRRDVFAVLHGNAQGSKNVKGAVIKLLTNYHRNLLSSAWMILRLCTKAMAVVASRHRRLKSRILTYMSLSLSISHIKAFSSARQRFYTWKGATKMVVTIRRLREIYTSGRIAEIVQGWRRWAHMGLCARANALGLSRKHQRSVLIHWSRTAYCDRAIRTFTVTRHLRLLYVHFAAWYQNYLYKRTQTALMRRAVMFHSQLNLSRALTALTINAALRTTQRLRLSRASRLSSRLLLRRALTRLMDLRKIRHERTILSLKKDLGVAQHRRSLVVKGMKSLKGFVAARIVAKDLLLSAIDLHARHLKAVGISNFKKVLSRRRRRHKLEELKSRTILILGRTRARLFFRRLCQEYSLSRTAYKVTCKVGLRAMHGKFDKWLALAMRKRSDRICTERALTFRYSYTLSRAIKRWSIRSLRKVVGYQIADRQVASKALRLWHSRASKSHTQAVALWLAENYRNRRLERAALYKLLSDAVGKRRFRYLLEVHRARTGPHPTLSPTTLCFKAWVAFRKHALVTNSKITRAKAHYKLSLSLRVFRSWCSVLSIFKAAKGALFAWNKAVVSLRPKQPGRHYRLRRLGTSLRALQRHSRWRKSYEAAARHRDISLVRRALSALSAHRMRMLSIAPAQTAAKRAVLRKLKISALKDKLSSAHYRSKLLATAFANWSKYDSVVSKIAVGADHRRLLSKTFNALVFAEFAGRRERWVGKLMRDSKRSRIPAGLGYGKRSGKRSDGKRSDGEVEQLDLGRMQIMSPSMFKTKSYGSASTKK